MDESSRDSGSQSSGPPIGGRRTSKIEDFVETCLEDAARHGCPRHHHPLYPNAEGPSGVAPAEFAKIHADTRALANRVLNDAEQNYSVCGYNERAEQLFGKIYLGLDKGPEYDRQAIRINSAIQALSAKDAYESALNTVRATLASMPDASDAAIFVAVLAQLCTLWFDIPDGNFVVPGGARSAPPTLPALCPGDYAVPSACMFYEEGDARINEFSQAIGHILKEGHLQHHARLAENGEKPKGYLSRAIEEALPGDDRDLIVRSTIGVMMGMLPTTYFNLVFVLEALRSEGGKMFSEVQSALRDHTSSAGYERAYAAIARPMMQAMQARPMPPEVWRTATQDHVLGDQDVKAGDHVIVDIAKVTAADLQRGKTDVLMIFGGDKTAASPPTHACPGYEAAIAIMLGTINGLMEPGGQ